MKTEKTTPRKYFVGNKKLKNVKMFEEFLNEAKKPTTRERDTANKIFNGSNQIDNWAIDYNPETGESESNGGKEFLVYLDLNDKFYLVQTNQADEAQTIHEVKEDQLDKDDHILVSIKKYRAENK
jgi:hypothetical protein